MVELYVGGQRIGSWADAEHLFIELAAKQEKVEFRDETGRALGRFVPFEPSPFPDRAEIDRRCAAGGGQPLAEFWKTSIFPDVPRQKPTVEEEEYARRIRAAGSLEEMFAVMGTAPLALENEIDIVREINQSRVLTGFRMPDPEPTEENAR